MSRSKKDAKKKKSIPVKDILKAVKGVEYLDLGEPFGESARRYLAKKLTDLIDSEQLSGSVITPEGVYISLSSKEVKNIVRLIKAKGICDLSAIAKENNWNQDIVYLIANSERVNLLPRTDGKVITRETALDLAYQQLNLSVSVDLAEVVEELLLKDEIVRVLLAKLLDDGRLEGYLIKSTNKFLPIGLLEESIKEKIEDLEMKNTVEVTFAEIAEEYGITDEHVYNILLKLFNAGDIEVKLNLGQKTCTLIENVEEEEWSERIPDEEKKLDIEDLTEKK